MMDRWTEGWRDGGIRGRMKKDGCQSLTGPQAPLLYWVQQIRSPAEDFISRRAYR